MAEKKDAYRGSESEGELPLHGIIAEYDTPGDLIAASRKVRDAGYEKWDTYTPFPVHGIDPAMGIKMTKLPWIVLVGGLTGLITAITLQWWTNAVDYRFLVSGKPFWSIPANVPIFFELTVLFSAFAALGGMLVLNNLPEPAHPLDLKKRFARVTDDKFFLVIQAADSRFDEVETKKLLESTHPAVLDFVNEDRQSRAKLPTGLVYGLIIAATAAMVPFAFVAKARAAKSTSTRVHAMGDMDWQLKYQAQQPNTIFADGRAERADVPGTVAVGELREDAHLYEGKENGAWARTFPPTIEPSAENLARGQQRFGIYCAPCHGMSGNGDGAVAKRAASLAEGTWIPPTNLHQDYLRVMPVGQLFNTVTHGVRNMAGYGQLIPSEDRWKILMYVRALQRSRQTGIADVPEAERASLK
ncbi:MAG: quinol:electron acceptor oxidoreductase subunit ActD [Polyangiaceae bacterium]